MLLSAAGHVEAAGDTRGGPVRGVAASEQQKYLPIPGSGEDKFLCLNSAPGASPLPLDAVNDDFCDCDDGSDEPGTSACAGQQDTLFYCNNDGSDAAFVYSSRVNDGICDCCDGSDEWAKPRKNCPNTCDEEGRERKKERQRFEADVQVGVQKRRSLIATARSQNVADGKELAKLLKELKPLEDREKEAEAALQRAEKAQEEQKQRQQQEQQQNLSASTPSTSSTTASPPAPDSSGDEKVVSEYTKWMDGAEEALQGVGGAEKADKADSGGDSGKGEEKVVSEYTKWMDGAEEALQETSGGGAEHEAEANFEGDLEEDEEEEQDGFLKRHLRTFSDNIKGLWRRLFSDKRSPAERAVDEAKKAQREAHKAVVDIKAKIRELESKAQSANDEDQLAFSDLGGRCISKKFKDYNYELCFFKSAKQDSVSIGNWRRWEKPDVGLFDGGQHCPGGLERSLRVHFRCASKEELMEVSEPSRCSYAATLAHPGACTEVLLKELGTKRVRMPTDEL